MDVDPFSPTNSRRLIAAIAQHGVSVYNGSTWSIRDNDDGFNLISNDNVICVRYDPIHSNIVWAGARNWDGHGSGIYLSQDGGTTWTNVNNELGKYVTVKNIDINPYDGTVFLGSDGMYTFSIQDVLDGDPLSPLPLSDSDGDGIPDGWEDEHFGGPTNAHAEADTDGDGLSDLNEYRLNTCPTNTDSDADGMTDGWEAQAFGDTSQDPEKDPDGDRYSNRDEYYWLTDARSATSHLSFVASPDAGCTLDWNSSTGRNYSLHYTDDDLAYTGLTWSGLATYTNMPGVQGSMSRTDTVDAVESRSYRLSVTIP
jgi:hypothetical protein